jgi:ketosteroid isomerase-like protein
VNHEQTKCVTGVARPMLLFTAGAAGAVIAKRLLVRGLLFKFRRDIAVLNAGDYQPVLSSYAEDAVLHFNEGPHRWAGEHRGKPAIASFLQSFVDAGIQGEIAELFISGPPWRMTLLARFDDHASASTGEEIYRNRTVLLARTRWGRIVRQEDFYEDTQSINTLETRLLELGMRPSERSLK